QRTQVMMQADSVELARLSVQKKTLLAIKGNGADSKRGRIFVDHSFAVDDFGYQGIEVRMVHVPALRICHRETDGNTARGIGRNWQFIRATLAHRLSG